MINSKLICCIPRFAVFTNPSIKCRVSSMNIDEYRWKEGNVLFFLQSGIVFDTFQSGSGYAHAYTPVLWHYMTFTTPAVSAWKHTIFHGLNNSLFYNVFWTLSEDYFKPQGRQLNTYLRFVTMCPHSLAIAYICRCICQCIYQCVYIIKVC